MTEFSIPTRRRSRRLRRGLVGLAAVTVAAGAVAISARASDSSGGGYRTTTVSTRSVSATLDQVGVVEPVSQAAVAFPTSGTVATVLVKTGDTVSIGQPLATLDTVELRRAVNTAQATLDQANLRLEKTLDGEDVGGAAGGAGAGTGGVTTAGGTATAAPASGVSLSTSTTATATVVPVAAAQRTEVSPEIAAAQQAIVDAQRDVDDAQAQAAAALASAADVCAAVGLDSTPTTGTDGSTTTTATTSTTGASSGIAACQEALQTVLTAQERVSTAQAAVDQAAATLTGLLDDAATTPSSTAPSSPSEPNGGSSSGSGGSGGLGSGSFGGSGTANAPSAGSGSAGTPSAGGSATTGSSPTAADIIARQKDVSAAEASLAVAQQALAQATIVSPIAGTITSVGLNPGDAVTAGSSTATVLIEGAGGYEVTTSVAVTDLPDVAIGQEANVYPDGSSQEWHGTVVAIALTGTSGTSSYPVTVALDGDTETLASGTTASVGIVTGEGTDAIAVPTSAVTIDAEATTGSVQVLRAGKAVDVKVGVGVVGANWTEITSGLRVGETVVVADLSEPLPGSATDGSAASSSGGRSGFPGGAGNQGGPMGFRPGN